MKQLTDNGFTAEQFNSNNGWGFGGAAGTHYTKGDIVVTIATVHYRHTKSDKFIAIRENGKTLLDLLGHGKRQKQRVLEVLKLC